jgi:hypothetical protein
MEDGLRPVPVLLIGGPGRSGTNILKDVLRAHPAVHALPFETRFPIDPDGLVPALRSLRGNWTPFTAERTLERLEALLRRVARRSLPDRLAKLAGLARPYRDWELATVFPRFDEHVATLLSRLRLVAFEGRWAGASAASGRRRMVGCPDLDGAATAACREFLSALYAGALAVAGRTHYVDDNTFNILFAEELLELLPGATLVHMVRDPRDVIASYLKQRWSPREPEAAAAYYRAVIDSWRRIRSRLAPGRYIEVRLEDLCRAPLPELGRICALASLPFDERMLSVALDRPNSGRWAREFDAATAGRLTAPFADVIAEYGYAAGKPAGAG